MIRIELKHIKKGGFFRFERDTNAKEWMKGERGFTKKKTWVYRKDSAALVDPNSYVYTKLEYIKPSKALNTYELQWE